MKLSITAIAFAVLAAVLLTVSAGELSAANQATPDQVKASVYSDINAAERLFLNGQELLKSPQVRKEDLRTAVYMFTEAGKLFEKAYNSMKTLGGQYFPQSDVQNVQNALNLTVEYIKKCNQILR